MKMYGASIHQGMEMKLAGLKKYAEEITAEPV